MKVNKLFTKFGWIFITVFLMALVVMLFIVSNAAKSYLDIISEQKTEIELLRGQISEQSQEISDFQEEIDGLIDTIQDISYQYVDVKMENEWLQHQSHQGDSYVEDINYFINCLCAAYPRVDPYIVQSIVYHESRYNPNVVNSGNCVGLTQLSAKWFTSRAEYLGLDSLIEEHSNLIVCVHYLNELLETKTLEDALYQFNHSQSYVHMIISTANELRNGGE